MKEYRELIVSLIGLVIVLIGAISTIWEVINDSAQFRALLLVGYVVFVGGILWFAFKGTNVQATYRWVSLGFLYIVTIPFFMWVGSWEPLFDPCAEYGIEIIAQPYKLTGSEVIIQGSAIKEPPLNSLQLIGIADQKYWPHDNSSMTVTRNSWNGKSYGVSDYTAAIAYVGENSRILFDYFKIAGSETNQYPGITVLPDDVYICDSVPVAGP